MSRPLIGRAVRRLRLERGLAQQALAARLGVSASYLNLIEHDQRAVTAALLIKLAEILEVDLAALSGSSERQLEAGVREVFADPAIGAEPVAEAEAAALVTQTPNAARALLALYRAWRIAREDASALALPSGRRVLLPHEEVRDAFHERGNYFDQLEIAAEAIRAPIGEVAAADYAAAMARRLARAHGVMLRTTSAAGEHRRFDPSSRTLSLSERLSPASRGFQLAFQLVLLEARATIEAAVEEIAPSSADAAALLRLGLLNYAAAAVVMPYAPFARAGRALRHDIDALADRFAVSFEQAAQRLSSLQRPDARGVPMFFLRVDPAGNVSKRFSAAGFAFARFGGNCPKWIVHRAFGAPGRCQVQVAELPDGTRFLTIARALLGVSSWGEPPPARVIALGCDITHAGEMVYADGIDLAGAAVGIGLSCRLCDRQGCGSRAFPPLEHRLALDPLTKEASPYRFTPRAG